MPFAHINLPFFFNKEPGLALPLIALQYHEVKIIVKYSDSALFDDEHGGTPTVDCYCDYIFLDSEERRRMAAQSHEYLIEQVQHQQGVLKGGREEIRLVFNHPVKELLLVANPSSEPFGFISEGESGVFDPEEAEAITLKLNGNARASGRPASYFTKMQPSMYHTRTPTDPVHVMSFALFPEKMQPSGTCNFSRIDNAQLQLKLKDTITAGTSYSVYAVNYNVLKIVSGMGGLAYSN